MKLSYDRYFDQVLGGWLGKSMGGAIGARFEGNKGWIEVSPQDMFPAEIPPNDDLDLQVLWLKVLEEKGAALTADDLAAAWLEGCWYPFNEYGIFRRNWRLGIHPPVSGSFTNQHWETGMGCPIRSEIWGYAFPGAPDRAAHFARLDGSLDHTEQSVGAEQMLAAMASMAFFVPDVRRLTAMFIHYLPAGSPIERLIRAAFQAHDEGLSLRDARDRLMAIGGTAEALDAQNNVPFTFLSLLYGGNDLQETLLAALRCGYDTDCTMATAGALIGQILGASRIPQALKDQVGDELVMGIEYKRREMTISALARDTARIGVLVGRQVETGVEIENAPALAPLPATAVASPNSIAVEYDGLPSAAPGECVKVRLRVSGNIDDDTALTVRGPDGWTVVPEVQAVGAALRSATVFLHAPLDVEVWPLKHIFTATLGGKAPLSYEFGVAGAGLYQFLGVYYDALPEANNPKQVRRKLNHHYAALDRPYLPEPKPPIEPLYKAWSIKLGRPALIPSREHEVDVTGLVGLRGAYACYVARTIISPVEQAAWAMIGNVDGFRFYLNDELVVEDQEQVGWAPFNEVHNVRLRQGKNHILLKLLKRTDAFRFTLGFRADTGIRGERRHNLEDWIVNLSDVVPK
jgi:ADP-ribosylglycohydrolase